MTRGVSKIARRPQSAVPAAATRSEKTLDEGSPLNDEGAIADFVTFFKLLDKWDREVGRHAKDVQ
jgi:hypothetical protein